MSGEPPLPANQRGIAITGVESYLPLNGIYPFLADPLTNQLFHMLNAGDFDNTIKVHVDWKGTIPGGARLILNRQSRNIAAMPDGSIQFTLNMAEDLRRGTNTLQITAYNADGDESEPLVRAPLLWTAPDWLMGLLGLIEDEEIRLGHLDERPINVEIWLYIPPKKLLSRSSIPGAGEIGLSGIQAYGKMELPFDTAEEIRLKAGARYLNERERRRAAGRERLGLSIFGTELSVGAYALGTGRFQSDGTLHFDAVGGGVQAEIAREWRKSAWVLVTTVLGAPPQVSNFLNAIPYVGKFMQRVAYGYLRAEGRLEGQFEYQIDPTRHFRNLTVIVEPAIEVGGQFDTRAIRLRIYGGGSLEATLLCYSNVGEDALGGRNLFCQGVLNGRAGLFAQAFWFSRDFSWEWRHVLWGEERVQLTSANIPETASNSWHLLGHGYHEPYAVFHKPLPGKTTPFSTQTLGVTPTGLATITASEVLVSNVYTYTEPSLALNPAKDNALLLWVHDDVDKPLGQNFDLAYSSWNGNTWSTPARVTDDIYLDGAPKVAWDSTGKGLAIWERLNDPALPITATLDTTTTQKIEIAWAQYDPVSDTWNAPAWLTINAALDHKPVLARNSGGQILAVWRQNSAGLLSGDESNPDRIMAAFYNGGWSTPGVAVDGIPGLVDLAVGYGNGVATIAYTRFLTPTGSITPTLQLFTSTWDGSTWSLPQQLTDDDLGHTNPQVVYNTLNQPLLIWQAGQLLRLRNLTTEAEASLSLDPNLVIDEFRLLHDAGDNLAAVFTGQQAGQRDLFVAFFDANHNVWGRPYRLTNDRHSEGYPAPALDSMGRLLMAYALTQISSEERTTTDPDTGEVITYTLPVEGQTDLYTLSHQFVQDLAMGAIAVSDDHPQPGAGVTVSATVTNTGALALEGVQVAFYDGDPDAGGTLIGMATVPGTLAAGYTATLTTTYTIPITGGQRQLVGVADPQGQIAEADETNNRASLLAFGPDLELVDVGVDYWGGSSVGLTAIVRNLGTSASSTTTIAYRWEAITGTQAVTEVVPSLAAGEAVTLITPWDYGALAQGSYRLVAVVNEGQQDFAETFTANNEGPVTLEVLPDLAVSPLYLWTAPLPDGRVLITATVYNFGSVPAPPTEVAIYIDEALTDTARIGVVQLPALDPAGQAVITAIWDSPEWGEHTFYAAVNPLRTVSETTWTNNLASVSGASACTLLVGDVDCSCTVDAADLQTIVDRWRQAADLRFDLDGDGDVDVADIMRVARMWGQACP
ncbi:MAG: CARDB domain-containing protein [Candidatus Methanomethylicaceae archaeon]